MKSTILAGGAMLLALGFASSAGACCIGPPISPPEGPVDAELGGLLQGLSGAMSTGSSGRPTHPPRPDKHPKPPQAPTAVELIVKSMRPALLPIAQFRGSVEEAVAAHKITAKEAEAPLAAAEALHQEVLAKITVTQAPLTPQDVAEISAKAKALSDKTWVREGYF